MDEQLKENARRLAINTQNLISRSSKVVNYRHKCEIKKNSLLAKIEKSIGKLDINECSKSVDELTHLFVSEIMRSNDVMIDVFEHHLPQIESLLRQLPRDELTDLARDDLHRYQQVCENYKSKIVQLTQKQRQSLESFGRTLSLKEFAEFKQYEAEELKELSAFAHDMDSRIKLRYRVIERIRKMRGRYNQFQEDHPVAVLALQVVISFGGLWTSFIVASKTVTLFEKIWNGADKWLFTPYWAVDYINEAVSAFA